MGKRKKGTTPRRRTRAWSAAQQSRLVSSWVDVQAPLNYEIRQDLDRLRQRSRELAQNSDHVRHFLRLLKNNVIGPSGITLQSKPRNTSGNVDTLAADAIEREWKAWGRHGSPDTSGRLSWRAAQTHWIETIARDGEALARIHPAWGENRHGFAVELIDPATLATNYNADLGNGRWVVMGVEVDRYMRAQGYWFRPVDPTSNSYYQRAKRARDLEYVPAQYIVHGYLHEFVNQARGVPWVASAALKTHWLRGYEEAELTAALVAARKMGFYTDPDGTYTADEEGDDGTLYEEAEAGTFGKLPAGVDFKPWDPQHPNSGFSDFSKSMLRSIASGLGVGYNQLANDLEGVNYSSLREGKLNDRDVYTSLQSWVIESFCVPIFEAWIGVQLSLGTITVMGRPLRPEFAQKYLDASWQGRRWAWVDPLKDVQAARESVALKIRSVSDIIREQGRDPAEVFEEIAREREQMAALGITSDDVMGASNDTQDADEIE